MRVPKNFNYNYKEFPFIMSSTTISSTHSALFDFTLLHPNVGMIYGFPFEL